MEVSLVFKGGRSRAARAVAASAAAGVLVLGVVAPTSAAGQVPRPDGNRPEVVDDELLVKFKPGTTVAAEGALHRAANAREVREVRGLAAKVVKVGKGEARQRLAAYQRNPDVELVELNGLAYPDWVPSSDGFYTQQWALNNVGQTGGVADKDIDAPEAWDITRGSNSTGVGSVISIVDTGIKADHPDLQGKIAESQNWYDGGSTIDVQGHGTHVAGIAAANTNNGTGMAGVCPDCKLLIAKVCDDVSGGCPYDRIANGILWTVGCEWRDEADNCLSPLRAQVINISLSGTFVSEILKGAVDKAWIRGAVITCAAGNDGNNLPHYPAAHPNCIATAATDHADQKPSWSNYGSDWVDVAAPGVGILSTVISDQYEAWSGTSMASPHVAGLAGLLAAQGRSKTEVRNRIESRIDRIGGTGNLWAKGRINACRAVGAAGC